MILFRIPVVASGWSLSGRQSLGRRGIRYAFHSSQKLLSSREDADPSIETWNGITLSQSEFATHVRVGVDQEADNTLLGAVENALSKPSSFKASPPLSGMELLKLGSVWFQSADAPRQHTKPLRMTAENATQVLQEGDYLRIHQKPRRFPVVHDYDWSKFLYEAPTQEKTKPGVILVQEDAKGFLVIDKPAGAPVHSTVDNAIENVVACIREARSRQRQPDDPAVYVAPPQRLDHNTSGLFVVATSKLFATYYANLLLNKTKQQLEETSEDSSLARATGDLPCAIHKRYRCLVCLIPSSTEVSVAACLGRLQSYAATGELMRHYLVPSIRAPKKFVREPKDDSWAECLLRVLRVGEICPVVGSTAAQQLSESLWREGDGLPECKAVVEVEVELLTGRTHQIRGQLSTEGFPLVGDEGMYWGVPNLEDDPVRQPKLALQCFELEFLDPDCVQMEDGTEVLQSSNRWNKFRLEDAWWSPYIRRYQNAVKASDQCAPTTADDMAIAGTRKETAPVSQARKDLLPPEKAMLAYGRNKYVLVKATNPSDETDVHWFVKSEAPFKCGGPYHADVAMELVDWIQAAGYKATVTGGGRIDYDKEEKHAFVYGFSYGFGKGDHAKAAEIIRNWSNNTIRTTYDDDDRLY